MSVESFVTPWTVASQASLSFTISWSLLKLMSIESVIPSSHLIFCRTFLLMSSIFPSIRAFSIELAPWIQWPKLMPELQHQSFQLTVVVVQSLSDVWLFVTPWTAARQASLSIANSWRLLRLMSIDLVKPSNHLILCHNLLLLPSVLPNIRIFSSESALCIRWPKFWSFSYNISPSNEYSVLISFRMAG